MPDSKVAGHRELFRRFSSSEARRLLMSERNPIGAKRKDGNEFLAEASMFRLDSEAGPRFTVLLRDVSTRFAAESAAVRLGRLLESFTVEVLVFETKTMKFLEASQAAQTNLGYTLDELRELTPVDISGEDSATETRDRVRRILAGDGASGTFRSIRRRKDGSMYPIEVHLHMNIEEDPPVIVAFARDISDELVARRKVEAGSVRIQVAEEQSEVLVASAPLFIFAIDKRGVIVSCAGGVKEFLGVNPSDLIGRNIWDLTETLPELRALVKPTFEGEPVSELFSLSDRVYQSSVTPIFDEQHNVTRIIAVGLDVTGQSRLEDQLRQAQRLDVLGQMAGGVAHDFNNVLTVIRGYAEIALSSVEVGHPLREDLRSIQEAEERGASLTRQLLAFGRRKPSTTRAVDLNDAIRMLNRLVEEWVKIELNLDPAIVTIDADPVQLDQVVVDLVANARDAMPGGGRVTISTQAEPEGGQSAGVILSVADTGSGMDDETKDRLFEPFFTTKEEGQATGLGLATVYGIIADAGASIEVDSHLGVGTVFTVRFPPAGHQ